MLSKPDGEAGGITFPRICLAGLGLFITRCTSGCDPSTAFFGHSSFSLLGPFVPSIPAMGDWLRLFSMRLRVIIAAIPAFGPVEILLGLGAPIPERMEFSSVITEHGRRDIRLVPTFPLLDGSPDEGTIGETDRSLGTGSFGA